MGTCIICGKETARMSGSESVNYIVLEGAEVIVVSGMDKVILEE